MAQGCRARAVHVLTHAPLLTAYRPARVVHTEFGCLRRNFHRRPLTAPRRALDFCGNRLSYACCALKGGHRFWERCIAPPSVRGALRTLSSKIDRWGMQE